MGGLQKIALMFRNKQKRHGEKFCELLRNSTGNPVSVDDFLPAEMAAVLSIKLGILEPSDPVHSWKDELNWSDVEDCMRSHINLVGEERVAIVLSQTPEFSFWSHFDNFARWSRKLIEIDETIMSVSEVTGQCFSIDVYDSEVALGKRYSIGTARLGPWVRTEKEDEVERH